MRACIIFKQKLLLQGGMRMEALKFLKKAVMDKSHLFACICFVLSFLLCMMGGISYSKYLTVQSSNKNAIIGSFSCDANISGVSATTFAYADFWSYNSSTDSYLQMNALRALNFTVQNYEGTGDSQRVSEVALGYSLTFSAPATFTGELAIQLFDKIGDTEAPFMPQVSLPHLMEELPNVGDSKIFHTESDQGSYTATDFSPMTFLVTHKAEGVIEAVEQNTENPMTITVTPKTVSSRRTIALRLWDVADLTQTGSIINSDAGELCAPLQIDYVQTVTYYSITISHPQLTIAPGVATTRQHTLKLVPVNRLNDTHIEKYAADNTGNPLKTVYTGQSIILKNNNTAGNTEGSLNIHILRAWQLPEDATEAIEFTSDQPLQLYDGDRQLFYLSQCYSKDYPMSIDVDFMQIMR